MHNVLARFPVAEGLVRFHLPPVRRSSRAIPEGMGIAMPAPAAPPAVSPRVPEKLGVEPVGAAASPATGGGSRSDS
jgi:hypothetical protein